jgi:hypothetical protein
MIQQKVVQHIFLVAVVLFYYDTTKNDIEHFVFAKITLLHGQNMLLYHTT